MSGFVRYPRTPHLAWLGPGQPRDDKILTGTEAKNLLAGEIVVEEKVDGANIGFSITENGYLQVQNRGSYLNLDRAHPQYRPLENWMLGRHAELSNVLSPQLMLFGEWCYATHSVVYDQLPDWFLGFDVYDRVDGKFWDHQRRDALLTKLRLHSVPLVASGHFSLEQLHALLTNKSKIGNGGVEGLVVRVESNGFTTARAKLVRDEFKQSIHEHWARSPLRKNSLASEFIHST